MAVAAAGVGDGDVREVVGVVVGVLVRVEVRQVGQDAKVGIIKDLVGVHPVDIRHGVALGGSLQLGPVLAPAGDLHVDDHVRVLGGVGVTHGLHTVPLVDVPNLEGQVGLAVCGTAASGD